jgi:hypothetical protein
MLRTHTHTPIHTQVTRLLNDWDFDNLCLAHNSNVVGDAKDMLARLLKATVPELKSLKALVIARRGDNSATSEHTGALTSQNIDCDDCG